MRALHELAELPDPPDNPEFCELPEAKQAELDARFQRGIKLGRMASRYTYLEVEAQRERNIRAQRKAQEAARAQARADAKLQVEILERARRKVRK